MIKRLAILLFIALQVFVSAQPNKVLEAWKKDKDLQHATYSFCIKDLNSGEIVSEFQSNQLLIPASTQKIFCTAAALAKFSSDYRFETQILALGKFDSLTGILQGDLIIRGSGDPSLQSAYFGKNRVVDKWAEQLANLGLKKIEGRIIGDASASVRPINANWLYEDVSNYYGAGFCALNYCDNKFSLYFNTGIAGTSASLTATSPNYKTQQYQIKNEAIASGKSDEAYIYGDPEQFTRTVRGTLPPNRRDYEVEGSLPDPALLCAEDLQKALLSKGISCQFEAESRYAVSPVSTATILLKHYSPKLSELVRITNQFSNNLYCESLRYLLGKGDGDKGLQEIKLFCNKIGNDTSAFFLEDACGLSRLNACNTKAQTNLLYTLNKDQKIGSIFKQSLSIAGKIGSLATIGKGTLLENNLIGKSGYMTRARGYCGYVTTKSGKNMAFSVIINNFSCSGKAVKPKFENFLLALIEL